MTASFYSLGMILAEDTCDKVPCWCGEVKTIINNIANEENQ
jgi:hypothetical protein